MLNKLEHICRICVEKYQSKLQLIEDTLIDFQNFQMATKEVLSFFINEEYLNSDEYPQFICTECVELAKSAFSFKMQCDESQLHLQEYFSKIKELEKSNENVDSSDNEKHDMIFECSGITDDANEISQYTDTPDNKIDVGSKDFIENCLKSRKKRGRPKKRSSSYVVEKKGADVDIKNDIYICTSCKKSFTNKYIFVAHKKRHDLKGHFLCNICGKGFSSQGCLTRHNRMHTGEKKFECNVCMKRFPSSNNLNLHMRIHTGHKPYLCTVCGKKFSHPTGLTYHMRTHTKERPYSCDVCEKRFTIQCHLDRHKKIHSGERPFSCSQCSKAFIKKIDMQRHEAIHSGEKPFNCNVCDKRFLRKVHLNLHMMLHTEERPHECPYCRKGFIRAYYLKDHINKHHNGESSSTIFNNTQETKPLVVLPMFTDEKSAVDVLFAHEQKSIVVSDIPVSN